MDISGRECARARESVSADLDRELHELGIRRLQAHLRLCADCSAWAEQVGAATATLREAPLEAYTPAAFGRPRRERNWRLGRALAVAPALALVASAFAAMATAHQPGPLRDRPTTSSSLASEARQVIYDGPVVRSIDPASNQHRVLHAI